MEANDREPSSALPRCGRIVYTLADGSRYEDLDPVPCQEAAYMWLGADGEPLGMVIDSRPYRIRHSPRLSVPGHFAMIQLCRRLKPGE